MTVKSSKVIHIDQERKRRRYIALANSDENFIQTKASFALSGIDLTDDDAELAGRIIFGDLTDAAAFDELRLKYCLNNEPPYNE